MDAAVALTRLRKKVGVMAARTHQPNLARPGEWGKMSAAEIPSVDPTAAAEQASADITEQDQVDLRDRPHLRAVFPRVILSHELPPAEQSQVVDAMREAGSWLGRTQAQIEIRSATAYRRAIDSSRSAVTQVSRRARRMRDQDPLRALALIAGTAFIAGIVLRFWRSHNS